MLLFCPECSAYFPAGAVCQRPGCGYRRAAAEIPCGAGEALWRARVPGAPATHPALATGCESKLLVAWGYTPGKDDARPSNGGVTALDLATGCEVWSYTLGMPIEGGLAVTSDASPEPHQGLVVAAMGSRGMNAGTGAVVGLELRDGSQHWRRSLPGAVRGAPVAESVRVYAAAGDGVLYCLDARSGTRVWDVSLAAGPAPIPGGPLVIKEGAAVQAIVTGTYGGYGFQEDGRIVALDERGRRLWEKPAGGNVRAVPVAAGGLVYVAAFRNVPTAGVLVALDARTGRPAWREPFTIQGRSSDRNSCGLSAAPLVHDGRLYVGSLNGRLYALDATTGGRLWEFEAGGSIATTPAWLEGLVIFGAHDGRLYAVDAATSQLAWSFFLGAAVLTNPLVEGNRIYCAAQDGTVAALPWHAGHYEWAATRLERAGRFLEAGDCRALAAHFAAQPQVQTSNYIMADRDWNDGREPERAMSLWLALDRRDRAVTSCVAAGERWRLDEPLKAACYFEQAAKLYYRSREWDALNTCTRALATCARLPHLMLQSANVPTFFQGEAGEFTLRVTNDGEASVQDVRLVLEGSLQSRVEARIDKAKLSPGQSWNIQLSIAPTSPSDELRVEAEYPPGIPSFEPMRSALVVRIHAVLRPQPLEFKGDIGLIKITVAGSTAEGVSITARDVGIVSSATSIKQVSATGDVGFVQGRGRILGGGLAGDSTIASEEASM